MCTLHESALSVLSTSPGRSSKSFNLDQKEMNQIKIQAWSSKEGGDRILKGTLSIWCMHEVSIIHMVHA